MTDEQLTIFRRRNIGFVFQMYNLIPMLNVWENIILPVKLDGKTPDRDYLQKIVEILGLDQKLSCLPNALSGGQQQRVAIARALAAKPALLLADEPTGNLDSRTSQDVLGLLKITGEEFFQTIIMITHNEEIAQLADRILRIEDGHLTSGSSPRPEKDRHPDQMNFSLENDGFAAQHLPASRHPDLTTVSPESSDRR